MSTLFKIDLHTHSYGSPDGGITVSQYRQVLESGKLDYIAITDHNRIDAAQAIQSDLGGQIIIGEEIMTTEGEIIGLYLSAPITPGMVPLETIRQIKAQGGLVYIPHPFESMRKGLHPAILDELSELIDIIEVYNGRAVIQDHSEQAAVWSKLNKVAGVASSDAHGIKGLGRTYTHITEAPTNENLLNLLAASTPLAGRPPLRALLYPKYHRLRKKIRRKI